MLFKFLENWKTWFKILSWTYIIFSTNSTPFAGNISSKKSIICNGKAWFCNVKKAVSSPYGSTSNANPWLIQETLSQVGLQLIFIKRPESESYEWEWYNISRRWSGVLAGCLLGNDGEKGEDNWITTKNMYAAPSSTNVFFDHNLTSNGDMWSISKNSTAAIYVCNIGLLYKPE
jgi:hypothetical protein